MLLFKKASPKRVTLLPGKKGLEKDGGNIKKKNRAQMNLNEDGHILEVV